MERIGPAECFVVTMSRSLYHIALDGPRPTITKQAAVGTRKSGYPLGKKLEGGNLILLTKALGIVIYLTTSQYDRPETLDSLNSEAIGDNTSPIIALFFSETRARECICGNRNCNHGTRVGRTIRGPCSTS